VPGLPGPPLSDQWCRPHPSTSTVIPDAFGAHLGVRGFDVHPDGRRFLFTRLKEAPRPQAPVTRLTVVHNWSAELERPCPTRR
jgi:hypothetical protein